MKNSEFRIQNLASIFSSRKAAKNITSSFRQGFSLVEIVVAMAIMSFALVGILALFPLALETAADSKAETRISLIAQSIISDIQATQQTVTAGSPPVTTTAASIFNGNSASDLTNTSAYANLPLSSTQGSVWLAYDTEGQSLGTAVSQTGFLNGVPGAAFISSITARHDTTEHPGLTHLEVRVDYPGSAPEGNRKQYRFVTLIRL